MAKFEEEKVINALHIDKAEIGKKYWYSDNILNLKDYVQENDVDYMGKLIVKMANNSYPFHFDNEGNWQFLYPYEEPPKQRWTHKMLAEWCIKCNGHFKYKGTKNALIHFTHEYYEMDEEKEIDKDIVIRPFGQTEWIEPTVDIYERDCKGGKE